MSVLKSLEDHEAVVTADFQTAKSELDEHPPDFLVTELRLGAFNGLHLAVRAQASGLAGEPIVIGPADSGFEADARQLHARYVPLPADEHTLSTTLREMLSPHVAA